MRPPDRIPAVAWTTVVAVVPLSAVMLLLPAMEPFHLVKWWVAVAAAIVGLASLARHGLGTGSLTAPPLLLSGPIAWLVASLIVSVAVADQQLRAVMGTYSRWTGASAYVAYCCLALLTAVVAADPRLRKWLTSSILLAVGAVLGYALIQRSGLDPLPWAYLYGTSTASFLGNPNFASGYMGIAVPLVVARMVTTRSPRSRVLYGFFVLALLVGQWTTGSWLGPFASAVGLGVMGVVALASSQEPRLRRVGATAAVVGPLAAGAALYGFWQASVAVPENVAIRLYYWRSAIDMFVAHPVSGVGFGRFGQFFRQHRPADGYAQFGEGFFADNPHSVLLALAAEGGLLVALPWLAVMAAAVWSVFRWVRDAHADASHHHRIEVAGWCGAFAGYLAQALASFDVPALAVLGFSLLGGVMGLTGGSVSLAVPGTSPVRRGLGLAVGVVAAGLVVVSTVPVTADLDAGHGARQAEVGNLAGGLHYLDQAAERAWWEPRYGFAAGQVAYAAGDLSGAQRRFEATATAFPRALQPVIWSARTAAELGQLDRAADWYRRAVALHPDDESLAAEASELIESMNGTP